MSDTKLKPDTFNVIHIRGDTLIVYHSYWSVLGSDFMSYLPVREALKYRRIREHLTKASDTL